MIQAIIDCVRPTPDDTITDPASGTGGFLRVETERSKAYTYDELVARGKANLAITWLRDPSLDDADNLPAPEVLAAEIVEDLQAALEEFAAIAETLQQARREGSAEEAAPVAD
ncbi:methyltransferase [Streptomyces sp. NPDC088812]|uniref:methyltransferase n=1 Tax=Streptomyces sp. NPDC088812 TaxID=3365905 RepID=UPI0038018222